MADLNYIETGYFDIGYYVYTADAGSTVDSSFTTACDAELITSGVVVEASGSFNSEDVVNVNANKIASGNATFVSSFNINSTISHIHGSDLFAFTEAAISIQVDRIRDNNTDATSVFSLATDIERTQEGNADADAIFSAIINGLRSRDTTMETQAAFSFVANVDVIKSAIDNSASLLAETSLSLISEKVISLDSNINCNVGIIVNPVSILDINVSNQFDFQISISIEKISDVQLSLISNITQDTNINVVRDSDILIQSLTTVVSTISHIEGADLFAFTNAELALDANIIKGVLSEITTSSNVTALGGYLKDTQTTLSLIVTQTTTPFVKIGIIAHLTSSYVTIKEYAEDYADDYAESSNITVNVIRDIDLDIVCLSNFLVNPTAKLDAISLVMSAGSINAFVVATKVFNSESNLETSLTSNVNVKVDATANFNTSITSQIVAVKTTEINLTLFDNAIIIANNTRVRDINKSLTVLTSITLIPTKIKEFVIVLDSAMNFVIAIRDLRLDEIEYRIPAEGWDFIITSETRNFVITEETRLRKLSEETALRTIASETRLYTVD